MSKVIGRNLEVLSRPFKHNCSVAMKINSVTQFLNNKILGQCIAVDSLPPNRLIIPSGKRSKKGRQMRNLLVGLGNKYPSGYKVGPWYEVLFFLLYQLKELLRANTRDFPESDEVLSDQIRIFDF